MPKNKQVRRITNNMIDGTTPDEMVYFMKNGRLPKSAMRSNLLKDLYKRAGVEPAMAFKVNDLAADIAEASASHECTADCDHAVAGTESIVSTGQH